MTEVAHARLGFVEAVSRVLCHDADFAGRASRAECWWYALFYTLALSPFSVFDFLAFTPTVSAGSVLTLIVVIVTLLPALAVGVRRRRDSGDDWGHSCWLLIPVAGRIILACSWIHPTQPDVPGKPRGGSCERDSGNGGSHDGAATRGTIVPTRKER